MSKANKPLIIPTLIQRNLIFEESLIKLQRDLLQIENHPAYTYYSLHTYPFSVAILALNSQGAYILTEEYRHPTGKILLGCPGGYIDPGENPLQAARRELLEETGFEAQSFTVIGSAYPYVGISSQKTIYIRAQGANQTSQPNLEVSELIRTRLMTPEALEQAIDAGAELDGTLCTALFFQQRQPKNNDLTERGI